MMKGFLESTRVLRRPCVKPWFNMVRTFSKSTEKLFPELAMFSNEQEKVFCIIFLILIHGKELETGLFYPAYMYFERKM